MSQRIKLGKKYFEAHRDFNQPFLLQMKEKNFTCIVCAKSFVSAPARKLHMKSHDYAKYD